MSLKSSFVLRHVLVFLVLVSLFVACGVTA